MRDDSASRGWEISRFDSVAKVISGKNQKDVENSSGPYPVYGSGGVFGKSTAYLCEAGTTVVGRKGTINSPIFVNERFWNVDTAFGLSPISSDSLLPLFLFYFCQGFNFTKLDKSTTIPSLAKRDIEAIEFPLPPLAEQKRIVAKIEELFSELDAGEESLRVARRQLGVYRQSLLKQAFEGKLTEKWREEHADTSDPKETTLEGIVEIKSGNGFPTEFQGKEEGDYPFYKVGDISKNAQSGRRKLGRADNYISEAVLKKIRGTVIPPDATVFAKIGAAVALNRRAITSQPSLIDNNAMALIPSSQLLPDFLCFFMRQVDLGEKTRGGAVPSLRKSDIEEIPILLPSLPEQQEIVRLLDEQFEVIERNEREIDAALRRSEALRQAILKKAFSGQLVAQDPADEPASVLLARLQAGRQESVAIKSQSVKKARTRRTTPGRYD